MTKRIAIDDLHKFCADAFVAGGLSVADAATVAEVLVTTDTWGIFSHGTGKTQNYLQTLRAGGINATAVTEIVVEGPSWAVLDHHAGMGMVGSVQAMELAITKARTNTISWVGIRNSSHFGAAGYYANLAANHDMIGIAMSNADPNMTIPGACGNIIGNNPLAYAVPAGNHSPILFDVALSTVAHAKVTNRKQRGEAIPNTWITDAYGLPTTDLSQWPAEGTLQAMAGYKGFGFAILIEILAGAITQSGVLNEVKSWIFNPSEKAKIGQSFLVINVNDILPISSFKRIVDGIIDKLHAAPLAKDHDEPIHVPGEAAWKRRRDALDNGLALPDSSFEALRAVAASTGLTAAFLK